MAGAEVSLAHRLIELAFFYYIISEIRLKKRLFHSGHEVGTISQYSIG